MKAALNMADTLELVCFYTSETTMEDKHLYLFSPWSYYSFNIFVRW